MTKVLDKISTLNFDIREIFEIANTTPGCLRSDLGQINYPVAPEVYQAMADLTESEKFLYAPTFGDEKLLKVLTKFENKYIQHYEDPKILITSGGQAALFSILSTFIDNGDMVVTDLAYYPPYRNIPTLIQGTLLPTDLDNIESIDTTLPIKVVLITTPNNPTGKIYSEKSLQRIAKMARKHDWLVVEDAVYDRIYFDDPPPTIAKYCPERTLVLNTASKNFCMPGMRIGWVIGENHLISNVAKMHRNMNSCPNAFFQKVMANFIPKSENYFIGLRKEMSERKDLILSIFDNLGWTYIIPQGAIYVFVTIPNLTDSNKFVIDLITNIGVSAMPGTLFGNHNNCVRFCFGAITQTDLKEFELKLAKL